MKRPSFRRRNFFVKQGFQLRFAFYPISFLAIFLLVSGFYLKTHLEELLRFQLYLPHSHLENPWDEVFPELIRVASWGGGVFLVVLAAWCWLRFSMLKASLERLADWAASVVGKVNDMPPPHLKETEAAKLAKDFYKANLAFREWDDCIALRVEDFIQSIEILENASKEERINQLPNIRNAWHELWNTTTEVRIDEGLS